MLLLGILVVLVVVGLVRVLRRDGSIDAPARIVTVATNRLPAHRREWGQAMIAELTEIPGRARRWQFTLGVLRVVLFSPSRHRNRALVVAVAALMVAVVATGVAAEEVPSLSVFVAVLSLLLGGYTTAVTWRSPRPPWTASYMIVGAVALAGAVATITTVVWIAVAPPSATTDPTHLFSVLFALILTVYLAVALAPRRLDDHVDTLRWWAIVGALVSGAVWVVSTLTAPVTAAGGVTGWVSPVGAAATLAVSIGASAITHSRRTGIRAGLLTAILGAPILFAVDMTALLHLHQFTLTDPYDIAAYSHSGHPDVASYILSDALGDHIIGGLVLYPIVLFALAVLGSAAGIGLHRLAHKRTAH
jgi:hypothetical protein